MKKPITNTAWAIGEAAKRVEPLESQRQSGWVYQDAPSSGVVNSWMNAVHQWQVYLEQFDDQQEMHIAALEQHVLAMEGVIKHQAEETQRIWEWLEKHQVAPEKPPTRGPSPSMPSYKWDQIQRNNGGRY